LPGPIKGLLKPLDDIAKEAEQYTAREKLVKPAERVAVEPLPEKNVGTLRGGRYPFAYDPVYGLPVVNDVVKYGEALRDMREGRIKEVLWFLTPPNNAERFVDGRCLLHYKDGRVKQSVLPPFDLRIKEAMEVHAVRGVELPPEPRHVPSLASYDREFTHPFAKWYAENVDVYEDAGGAGRRGPRVGPTTLEAAFMPDLEADRREVLAESIEELQAYVDGIERMDTDDWEVYKDAGARGGKQDDSRYERAALEAGKPKSWMDNIQISQEMQVLILRYVPIVGPILGSAFIIGLYMASRLVRGDLTDRMKMMSQEDDKKKRTALKEARIAFLEEEVPALVARGASIDDVRKKAAEVNKKLGSKFEISDTELQSTLEACQKLLEEGSDISGAAGSASAADRILAEEEEKDRQAAQKAASEGGDGGEADPANALMEMGKLNTARIRKAVDPRILEVKRRVRQARRGLKRDSKVQLSDEIIFFDDVAGNEQAKVELLEIVDFFRKPEKFRSSGAKAPKGVLLVGPPGNGKTLMARAVAGESGVAFISSSASEFIEMYMGLGAARVRDVFNTARNLAPCIIFIDELDAVGRARRSGGQGNDERDNTVNQLLTEMDGFEAEQQGIVVMAATNRKDVLDAALTRPGRFDRSIEVRRPDFNGRLEGIKVHLRDKPIAGDIDYKELALMTGGMSGAQLAGVCNTACFIASRAGRADVTMVDLRAAVEQSKYGKAYDAHKFISPNRKRRFAVMEAAISLTATLLPAIEPVDYVTISPSNKSPIGRTVLKPNVARYTTGMWTKRYLEEQLLVALAGRAAEEVVFGLDELSSLNQHRLMFARQIVHKMLNAGMSEHPDFENIRTLGAQWTDSSSEPGRFQTYTIQTDQNQSRSEWVDVDLEMEMKLNGAYEEVKALLTRNRPCLDKLVEALLQTERLEGDAVRALVEKHAVKEDLARRAEAREKAFI